MVVSALKAWASRFATESGTGRLLDEESVGVASPAVGPALGDF